MFNLSDLMQIIVNYFKVIIYFASVIVLIYLIIQIIRKKRARSLMARHLRKNLKSDYNYMDHASDNYHLAQSKVILCEHEYHIPNVNNSAKECVMVHYLYHNRMQETTMDEKHYFHIHLFYSDLQAKSSLYEKWKEIRDTKMISQPRDLNALSPIVLGLRICVVMYYKWKNTYYFIHKDNSFIIDYLVECKDVDSMFAKSKEVPATHLEDIVLGKIAEIGLKVKPANKHTGFSDIGIDDDDELYLRLFYFVEVSKPTNQHIASIKAKKIPQFINDNTELSKAFKSSLVKLNLLCEGKLWE